MGIYEAPKLAHAQSVCTGPSPRVGRGLGMRLHPKVPILYAQDRAVRSILIAGLTTPTAHDTRSGHSER